MTRYETEQQQITDAIAQVPDEFGLRAFPGKRFKLAHRSAHFVLDGAVQLVVQAQMTADEQRKYALGAWADFGRNTLAHLLKELVRDTPPAAAGATRRYLVSAAQTVRRTKVFEAASAEQAEALAQAELDESGLRGKPRNYGGFSGGRQGWDTDDEQDGPVVLSENTTEVD